ncbi:superoxide dismutase [Fulvivirga sp. M361]|nr:superoxide dismutase [Fulvivirga sp. M361]
MSACTSKSGNETEETAEQDVVSNFEELLQLPDLPYDYNALEATIDATTMEIHHGKHHQGYVNKLKAALETANKPMSSFEELFEDGNLPDGIRNNGGGHYNHSLFWPSLTPGGSMPSADFITKIDQDFGSVDELKSALISGGKSVFGSGWVWLIKDGQGSMKVTTTPNQDNPLMPFAEMQGTPLLGIDVWEHAYYLNYQNKRGDYLNNIMDIIHWQKVEERSKA